MLKLLSSCCFQSCMIGYFFHNVSHCLIIPSTHAEKYSLTSAEFVASEEICCRNLLVGKKKNQNKTLLDSKKMILFSELCYFSLWNQYFLSQGNYSIKGYWSTYAYCNVESLHIKDELPLIQYHKTLKSCFSIMCALRWKWETATPSPQMQLHIS